MAEGARAAGRARRAGAWGRRRGPRPRCSRGTQPSWRLLPGLWSFSAPSLVAATAGVCRAALGSWKSPGRDRRASVALSLPDVCSAYLAPGIPPVRGTAAVARDRPSVSPGACFACPRDPCSPVGASADGRTQCRMLLGHMSQLQACCGAGARQRCWGAAYTRGPRGLARTAQKLVTVQATWAPGPGSGGGGRKGPRWGGSRLATEAGGPTVCSVPGKGEVLGPPPGTRPPGE